MKFELDKLPFEPRDLEPHIGSGTVEVHYHKHHAGYMQKLENEIKGQPLADLSLDEIVRSAAADSSIFRNAAQVWNHTFYWNSLAPDGGGTPSGAIADLVERDFGTIERFKSELSDAALAQFGSGWAWLVANAAGTLRVISTSNADNPLRQRLKPLLALDVWEHAYYLDYQNERGRYVEACLNHLLNWHFAESNFELATVTDVDDSDARVIKLAAGSKNS
jgi:Fe-Mn family superoxide dismutase